jgi:phosphatidylethanolamine/phosphatidyl-N-methylethanolamine N-methyltransferase
MSTINRFYPADLRRFVRGWMANPWSVGAVAPSGRALTHLMTRDIDPAASVVELGPGTGTLTQAILERGVEPGRLTLVERGPQFVELLKKRFPELCVIEGDATRLGEAVGDSTGTVDTIVSGLPLVLFSPRQKRALIESSFQLLNHGGAFVQFTYGGRCPLGRRLLREFGLGATRVGIAARNLPPAFVYRIERSL